MEFKSIMHVTFFTSRLDEMCRFYTEVLGGTIKIVTKAKAYRDLPDSPYYSVAVEDPECVVIVYIELAPGQFIELFPASPRQLSHRAWNEAADYSHFALLVEDIVETRARLEARGLSFDTEIAEGPSETYQMWAHDPDGNRFEIMQYTDRSYQVVGHIM